MNLKEILNTQKSQSILRDFFDERMRVSEIAKKYAVTSEYVIWLLELYHSAKRQSDCGEGCVI